MLLITKFTSEYLASNMYVVSEGNSALLVDPCSRYISGLSISAVFVTHEHFDHISGINFWREKTSARFICSESCAKACMNPRKNLSHYFRAFCELQTWLPKYEAHDVDDYSCEADETYSGTKRIDWCGHEIELFECPGHSSGSQCIMIDGKVLFSGDSLINGFKTACGFPGGSVRKWNDYSLPMLKSLSRKIMVYPGHMESFVLEDYDDGTGTFWK